MTFAFGRLFHGIIIDVFGGSFVFRYGLLLSIFFNFIFSQIGNLIDDKSSESVNNVILLMNVTWALGRFFQAAGYGAMISILSSWYDETMHGRIFGLASLSYNLGDVIIRIILGSIMMYISNGQDISDPN